MTNLPVKEIVYPDAVGRMIPGPENIDREPWEYLDPCPACGARPHEAPEGVYQPHHKGVVSGYKQVGNPQWEFAHCWKCGHRPGTNVQFSIDEMRKQFEAFKEWQKSQFDPLDRGIKPPENDEEIAKLRQELAKLKTLMQSHAEDTFLNAADIKQQEATNVPTNLGAAPEADPEQKG